jgi:H+/gluconate symporter-like permease
MTPPPLRTRLAISVAAGSLTVAIAYAAIRLAQKLFFPPEPDPAVVIWSARAAMYWRFWIGLYFGGMTGLGAWAFASRDPARASRWLARAVVVAAIAITAQGLLVP